MEEILAARVLDLRRTFDSAFAAPADTAVDASADLIAIELGDDPHALRISDIAGLYADVKVTPCPSPVPALRGLAGFRGEVLPVYDLAALIGYPMSGSPRWLVVAAAGRVAFAFADFGGHFRVDPDAFAPHQGMTAGGHVREVAHVADRAWPVVDLPAVVAMIRGQIPETSEAKE